MLVDDGSMSEYADDRICKDFLALNADTKMLDNTVAFSNILDTSVYDALYIAGGAGFAISEADDLRQNEDLTRIVRFVVGRVSMVFLQMALFQETTISRLPQGNVGG